MPKVTIPTPLRAYTDGHDTIEAEGASVGALLGQVVASFPALRERLFDGEQLRRFVNVYVNDEDIRYLDDLDTVVGDRDEVSIIPAVAGG